MAVAACPQPAVAPLTVTHTADQPLGEEVKESLSDIARRDSNRHFERTSKLEDVSDQLTQRSPRKPLARAAKPGILLNDKMAAATRKVKKPKATFRMSDDEMPDAEEVAVPSEEDVSPGGKLRRRTVTRKGQTATQSDSERSDASWGDIRSNMPREQLQRPGREEARRVSKRDSIDSGRSSRKRKSSFNSASSHESDHSARRQTDLSHPIASRYRNAHSRDLPSCLRQTHPRATDPPLSLKFDPTMMPEATKQRGDMDKVADVILPLQGEKAGNVELGRSKLVEKKLYSRLGVLANFKSDGELGRMAKSPSHISDVCQRTKRT